MAGPLKGVRIVELGGLGPAPFAGMMLADNGAEVIRINRIGEVIPRGDALQRSRKVLNLDLKSPADIRTLLDVVETADALIEGFRPGTLERLGIGPEVLFAQNARLVVGRMTGWGQDGPYAPCAGHDLNYLALSGALHATGPADCPIAPPAMLGDFGGGGMMLAFAVTAAILHARVTGEGQVVDCAMVDGSALLMAAFYTMYAAGNWKNERGKNFIDGGAHFYGAYKTADGKFVSIGSIEPQFYALLMERLGLTDDPDFSVQLDESRWPELRAKLERLFLTKTRDEWCELLEHSDVCFAPVLSLTEAPLHPHAVARSAFAVVDDVVQPAPGPRYSATRLDPPSSPVKVSHADLVASSCQAG
jgi:alpha-methylacyl-CoA racemase